MMRALLLLLIWSTWHAGCEWGSGSKHTERLAMREVAAFSTASSLGKAGRAVIRDANAWTQYWQSRFTPNTAVLDAPPVPARPDIDFRREMLLVASEISGTCGKIRINSVRRRDDVLIATTVIELPPPGGGCAASFFNDTHIVAVERSALPVRFVPLDGTWSGPGALAQLRSERAAFTFACGKGYTDAPLRLDDEGRFSASGGFEIEPGIVISARYSGLSDGQTMSLEIELPGGNLVLPQSRFFLTRGESAAPAQSCGGGN